MMVHHLVFSVPLDLSLGAFDDDGRRCEFRAVRSDREKDLARQGGKLCFGEVGERRDRPDESVRARLGIVR